MYFQKVDPKDLEDFRKKHLCVERMKSTTSRICHFRIDFEWEDSVQTLSNENLTGTGDCNMTNLPPGAASSTFSLTLVIGMRAQAPPIITNRATWTRLTCLSCSIIDLLVSSSAHSKLKIETLVMGGWDLALVVLAVGSQVFNASGRRSARVLSIRRDLRILRWSRAVQNPGCDKVTYSRSFQRELKKLSVR